jgi:two-component system NtrC family sensor kinase
MAPLLNGRTYDAYGVDTQGASMVVSVNNSKYIVGIKYNIILIDVFVFFMGIVLLFFILMLYVLYHFAKTYSDDIKTIGISLKSIADAKEDYLKKKIPVTSNDEIGDLIIAFNKIQEKEIEHIEKVKNNERILMEQERLASLGQMIGGISHNLKTPIMSIAGVVEALKELVSEYKESIHNDGVTKEDHIEIAADMQNWTDKIIPHCSYMSDVINAVKDQATHLTGDRNLTFTVGELVNRIDILMNHELKKYQCILNTNINVNPDTVIKGEVNNLVQVVDNLIINSIHSYNGKSGQIDLNIDKTGDGLTIVVKDYGKGIPGSIKDKLFSEMVTTKGKEGTGLGLYMSNSIIKGRFGGEISFDSTEGKGTVFYIKIKMK